MLKYIPDIISGFLVAREIAASSSANHFWDNAYNIKSNEHVNMMNLLKAEQEFSARLREEVITGHNNTMELMSQAREVDKEINEVMKAYMFLVQQIEELGFRVDDENNIVTPEDLEVEDTAGEELTPEAEEDKGLPDK